MYESKPRVSVRVETYKSRRVFVVGAVPPATFALEDGTTLIEILSQIEALASNSHVVVYRRMHTAEQSQNGAPEHDMEAIQVDLERLLRQGDMTLNFALQPRDVIYVPNAAATAENRRVFVVGAVPPATFPLGEDTTLIEILSQIEDLKSRTHVVVYRRPQSEGQSQDGAPGAAAQPIRVDLDRLLRQGDMSLNLILEPRDVIHVPGGSASRSITVMGEVERPGSLDLPEGGMTLLQALVATGGFAEWAMPSRTRVLRMRDGQEETIKINVSEIMKGNLNQDIQLMPGDVVIVPERSLF
jgi:protein involved in polysaccharide export with SLBB domain